MAVYRATDDGKPYMAERASGLRDVTRATAESMGEAQGGGAMAATVRQSSQAA